MKRRFFVFTTIALALVAAQTFTTGGQRVAAQTPPEPDFSGVSDILNGRRLLFPVDDLVVTGGGDQFASFTVDTAQTVSGTVGSVISYPLPGNKLEAFATDVGRMFDLPNDVIVTLTNDDFPSTGSVTIRDQNPKGFVTQSFPLNNEFDKVSQSQISMADFTGDGYSDFVYMLGNNIYVLTASDVKDIGAGVFFSGPGAAPFDLTNKPVSLAAGDFDGDGIPEAALAAAQGKDVTIAIYTVQVTKAEGKVTAIALTAAGSNMFTQPYDVVQLALDAGAYTGAPNPATGLPLADLVLAYHYNSPPPAPFLPSKHHVNVHSIPVTANGTTPVTFDVGFVDNYLWQASDHNFVGLYIASERLDFYGPTDQVVVSAVETPFGNYSHLGVFTLDANLKITKASEQVVQENSASTVAIAVGNFDQDIQAQQPIDLEIAVLKGVDDGYNQFWLYHVDVANNFALDNYYKSSDRLDFPGLVQTLRAGDTQGRSLLLGPPTKLVVEHSQPDVVLAMPPMHVDWVAPYSDTNPNPDPEVLNLSAVPGGFNSVYQTSVTQTDQSSRNSTTSYSHAVSTTVSGGYRWGDADTGSVSAQFTASAGYMHQEFVSKVYSATTVSSFNASTTTGFDDQLWYTDERHNIYVYPVIGQTACPAEKPNCSESERLPSVVMFSGPDTINQYSVGAATVEWYQPVHEPGNILSYPWDLAQLQSNYPNLSLLTSSSPTEFYTDISSLTEQAQWQGQNSQSVTSGSTNNITWGASFSVSRTPPKAGGLSGSFSAAYNGSKGVSTLHTATTAIGQSTGIGVNKPGTFPSYAQYQYGIQPFIFGRSPVTGSLHTINLGTDIQTIGILHAQFVADARAANAGSWWGSAYDKPDVALNHPLRWSVSTQVLSDPLPANCLHMGAQVRNSNCATFNAPGGDVWTSDFYGMKGLLITPVVTPSVAPANSSEEGPQIMQATAGDQVQLQARVYNYSLADMPADSRVIVRFYGQPWDQAALTAADDAFLIDQVELPPIPAFNVQQQNGGEPLPNWVLASTTRLDTAAYSDQYLAFWVVVWMQDGNGNLVAEMPDHGLTGLPGALTDISNVPIEDYSNNVGMYQVPFYIAPQNAPASAPAGANVVTIENVTVEPKRALLNEKVNVSAVLRAGDQAVDGVSVRFYDGDPNNGGKAFDVENIAHIRAHEAHQVRVPFRAETCGLHTLTVTTYPQAHTASVNLNVRIKPLPVVRDLIRQTKALALRGHDRRELFTLLREARQLFRHRDVSGALHKLGEYRARIEALHVHAIPADKADLILAQVDLICSCVGIDAHYEMTHEELMEDQAAGHE